MSYIKPDGSAKTGSRYYECKISSKVTCQAEDIIEHTFNNDFDFGNAFKALKRLHAIVFKNTPSKNNNAEYEINKIKHSLERISKKAKVSLHEQS